MVPALPPVAAVPPGPAAPARPAAPAVLPLDRMPRAFRDTLPQLRLDVLVYSDNPGERMVFINTRKYTEGQTVEGTLRLDAITADGAVLSHQGQRFLLPPP
jgi:general secretion pathway protein B